MKLIKFLLLALTAASLTPGCKKEEGDYLPVPKEESHFTNKTIDNYAVIIASAVKKVPIGITTASDQDRTVNFEITSPTGAQQGVHYNVSGKSLVIKAGQTIDSLTISAVFAQYQAGRKDTLKIRLVDGGSVPASKYNNEFILVVRGACFEGEISDPVALASLRGTYANTREDWGGQAYGPYTTTISSATLTSASTATITVTNIFDFGWAPITFTLDWTTINDRKITLVQQTNIAAASTAFGAGQAGTIQVGPHAQIGTFSYCNQVLTLRMNIGVTGLGYDPDLYEVVLRR
jgi:hypothetical protein